MKKNLIGKDSDNKIVKDRLSRYIAQDALFANELRSSLTKISCIKQEFFTSKFISYIKYH